MAAALVTLGFEVPELDPWTAALLQALGERPEPPGIDRASASTADRVSIGAVEVPDVSAEARWVARAAAHDPDRHQ